MKSSTTNRKPPEMRRKLSTKEMAEKSWSYPLACVSKTVIATAILVGVSSVIVLAGGQLAVQRPNKEAIVLTDERMTFRRISPRQYDTNAFDFFLLESEVTNEMYQRFLKATGRKKGDQELADAERKRKKSRDTSWMNSTSPLYDLNNPALLWTKNGPPAGRKNHPVALLTIHDAKAFCEWLTQRHSGEGLFRLPTVQEWLIAAYGEKRKYPWGDEWSLDIPCVSSSEDSLRSTPEPVRTHARDKTPEGIYDLWGNVAEYVLDPKDFPSETRWMGPSFKRFPFEDKKSAFPLTPRNHWWGYVHNSESKQEDVGFRVLLEPTQP